MASASQFVSLVFVSFGWVALIISITTLEWLVVTNSTPTIKFKSTWSVIGRVYTETQTVTTVNVSTVASLTDHWAQTCSGACNRNLTVFGCSDLNLIAVTDQQKYYYDTVCTYGYAAIVLCSSSLAMAFITFMVMIVSLFGRIPPIYPPLLSSIACVIVLAAVVMYGAGILSRANDLRLGVVASSFWGPGYSYGLAIASACCLFIAAVISFFFRQSDVEYVQGAPGGQQANYFSPVQKAPAQPAPAFSPFVLGSPQRGPIQFSGRPYGGTPFGRAQSPFPSKI